MKTRTVDLLSAKRDGSQIGDLYEDAEIVRRVADEMGDEVMVLGHSYGGMVITQALSGVTNVSRLLFLTASMLNSGTSLIEACGNVDPPWWIRSDDGESIEVLNPKDVFYNTSPERLAERTSNSLRPQSVSSFSQKLTECSWLTIPSTYIVCRNDNAIPLEAQEAMSRSASKVVSMDVDHSPFLSNPDGLAEIILKEFI